MKSPKEIMRMLVPELFRHLDRIDLNSRRPVYYNDILGDTSFLFAGLLEGLLKKNLIEWDRAKWIDDSIITNLLVKDTEVKIDGVVIFGERNTTEQWTEPFSFWVDLDRQRDTFRDFIISFGDLDSPAITYERFKAHPNHWASNSRNWKYIIPFRNVSNYFF